MKLAIGFLIFLASVVVKAVPILDELVLAAEEDIDQISRESRSINVLGVPWHLDRIDQQGPLLDGKYKPFRKGKGVDIYILADGVEDDNREFGGRAFNVKFMPPYPYWKCTKYGTLIAKVTAGNTVGVAKKSQVHVLSVTDDSRRCPPIIRSKIAAKAIQYVIERIKKTHRRSVLAMPMTGSRSPKMNAIVEDAVAQGIVVVTAAGDWFQDACKFSPGSSPQVINVGSTTLENGTDVLHDTNVGSCVSLYAPGQYNNINGTAVACGIVAGASALVLEQYPDLSPADVKQYLIDHGTDGVLNGAKKLIFVGKGKGNDRNGDDRNDINGDDGNHRNGDDGNDINGDNSSGNDDSNDDTVGNDD